MDRVDPVIKIISKSLYHHKTSSIINMRWNTMSRPKIYKVKHQYDDMKVIGKSYNKHHQLMLTVECTKCHRIKTIAEYALRQHHGSKHKSCGKGLKLKNKRFYTEWRNLRTRTTNPNYDHKESYKTISSTKFQYFIDFYDTMYDTYIKACKKYGEENVTLDRIDPNKDYSPENCRWTTWTYQHSNVKRSKLKKATSPNGNVYYFRSTTKFAKKHNIAASTIRAYLNPNSKLKSAKGWSFEIIDPNDYRKISNIL